MNKASTAPGERLHLRALGVGSAHSTDLGPSSFVLEYDAAPSLVIDLGIGALARYQAVYGGLPEAVYISHAHLDHAGDLERLFYQAVFTQRAPIRLYTPAVLVPLLTRRFSEYPLPTCEADANFWDCFQLVPVLEGFIHQGRAYRIHPTRHHGPNSCFGLSLPGRVFISGDTRPIPEYINAYAGGEERILHDVALHGNPSHAGPEDLLREYPARVRERMHLYHLHCAAEIDALASQGWAVLHPGDRLSL